MQGIHKEGEFRQLEIWTWKSYGRLHILHNSKKAEPSWRIFMEYLRNIGANNYQRGTTRWSQPTCARQGAQARPGGLCPPRPTSGAHLLVYKSFWPRKKIIGGHSGWSAAVSRRNLCRSTFAFRRSDSIGGTSLPEGEIIIIIITNNSPILGRAISINIFTSTISSQTLVHLLYLILLPKL